MRSFNTVLTLALLVSASALFTADPTRTRRAVDLSIDGDYDGAEVALATIPAVEDTTILTNAERLTRGLKLLPPKRRSGTAALARRSAGAPLTKSGVAQILAADGTSLGYIAENTNNNNHFGLTTEKSAALGLQFTIDSTVVGASQLDIGAATSYAAAWPLMGAIDGVVNTSDNLSAGSTNFAYIQGVTHTPPSSPPASVSNSYPSAENCESAIWSYNALTNALTAQWVNTDGSLPPTAIAFVSGSNALLITGDYTAFSQAFATSQLVTLVFAAS
ncbi:hypothetical protein C8R46DRAFT_1207668 [Mycena filopes]|nr:hypothetical protein C8R46DRAFT_1207668 [Mycena filopes]